MKQSVIPSPTIGEDIHCAPWCGFKCTRAAFDRATREADELAQRMGEGWEPRVWENGGWHYEVTKGDLRMMPGIFGGAISGDWEVQNYSAWINVEAFTAGKTRIHFIEHAETPEDALGFAVQAARTAIARIEQALEAGR